MDYSSKFRGLVTPDLSDACDALGVSAAVTGTTRAMYENCRPICGPVVTIEMRPEGTEPVAYGLLDGMTSARTGSVVLVSTGGRTDLNTWGSIAATIAVQQGIAGFVSDGATRNIETMRELDFPTYATSTTPTSVRDRIAVKSVNKPVYFAGTLVEPGWIAAADENGVIIFPASDSEAVFALARRIAVLELKTRSAIKAGADPVAVMRELRYDTTWTDQFVRNN